MKILITGATGYIGSYLMEYLVRNTSHKIIALCRDHSDYFKKWKNRIEIIKADITSLEELKRKVPKKVDVIVHLAAFNNIDTKNMPEKALIINGIGTRNMLEICQEKGCKFFIYFSVLQVYGRYGKEIKGKITVDSPVFCANDYSLTHYVAEEYCKMYASNYNLNISVLRPSNIFGCPVNPKIDRWSLVPACFCLSAYKKNEIRLKSSGKQTRDFVSLNFVCESVKKLIESNKKGFNIYNLTSEKTFSILEVTKMVQCCSERILKTKIPIICESKYPLKSSGFLAVNNLLEAPKREDIERELFYEIEKTLKIILG